MEEAGLSNCKVNTNPNLIHPNVCHPPWPQVFLNHVSKGCLAKIACKLESLEPCCRYVCAGVWLVGWWLVGDLCVCPVLTPPVHQVPLFGAYSVKDRIAYAMIQRAEEQGLIKAGVTTLVRVMSLTTFATPSSLSHLHSLLPGRPALSCCTLKAVPFHRSLSCMQPHP